MRFCAVLVNKGMNNIQAARTVVLTRPEQRNQPLQQALQAASVATLSQPALEVVALITELPNHYLPEHYDLVVFVSGQAAQCYLRPFYRDRTRTWPIDTKIGTVGVSTRQVAQAEIERYEDGAHSLQWRHPPATARNHDSESLWSVVSPELATLRRVLIVRGQTGRDWLRERLHAQGLSVDICAVYERRPTVWDTQIATTLIQQAHERGLVFLVTSSESATAIFHNLNRLGCLSVCQHSIFVVIHERIEKRVQSLWREAGFTLPVVVKRCIPTHESMVAALQQAALSPQII